MHNIQAMLQSLFDGLSDHLGQWDGWAVVIAAALFGLTRSSVWMPVAVALVINPALYGLVAAVVHGRHVGVSAAAVFTLLQIVLGYVGYGLGRIVARFR